MAGQPFSVQRDRLLAQFDEAAGRFRARLAGATPEDAVRAADDGAWSVAQIGGHVAAFNSLIAGILTGSIPAASAAPEGFVDRPWNQILPTLSDRIQAPARLHPPADTTRDQALAAFDASAEAVRAALTSLSDERAVLTMTHPRVGTIRLAQLGDWIVAHTIRHNAQMKRALGR
jgi:uncharacterized damage-inducible protein DinB